MSSLAYSLPFVTQRKQSNLDKNGSPPAKAIRAQQSRLDDRHPITSNVENQTALRRRDVIGIGVSTGILAGTPLLPIKSAVAVEAAPSSKSCEFTVLPSGLAFCDQVVGTGPQAVPGQLIKANYVGKLENGTMFDSSYNRGKPLTFRVGIGEVIKGWDQGIIGSDDIPPMQAGGKRKLRIPPELGYGMRGAGCRGGTCIIPPNSVLLFDVEFIGKA